MFSDRRDAGQRLAIALGGHEASDIVVVGLARGGVPVAAEVAMQLDAPLDVSVVRKLGCPWQPELGIGAIAEGGVRVINTALLRELAITPEQLEASTVSAQAELARRVQLYRGDRPPCEVAGLNVIVVDDGLATGYTARAAIEGLRRRGAERIVLAVPIASYDVVTALRDVADDVVVVTRWPGAFAVGQAYVDFSQTTDAEVVSLLREGRRAGVRSGGSRA